MFAISNLPTRQFRNGIRAYPKIEALELRDVPSVAHFYAVGTPAGGGTRVAVFNASTNALVGNFSAFETSCTCGVTTATGDVNGDGVDDVIVASGEGGGPRIRVFDGTTVGNANPKILDDFFAMENTFRGGLSISAGDVNGDGHADLIIGAGSGGAPRVRVLDGATLTSSSQKTLADFFAFESTFRGGVNVGSGDFNGDGHADIMVGSGIGDAPRVRVLNGVTLAPMADYFAFDTSLRNGVTVTSGDMNNDGVLDVIAATGENGHMTVNVFDGLTNYQMSNISAPIAMPTRIWYDSNGISQFYSDAFIGSFSGGVSVD